MSLNAVLQAIRATGEAKFREIDLRAQIQAHEVMVNSQADVKRMIEESRAAALAPAGGARARIIHHARLEALRIMGDVREELVDTALDQTCGRLASIRTDNSYPTVLRRLTDEALAELGVVLDEMGKAQLEADPRDRVFLESILFDMGLDLPVSYELNCWGGLIVRSEDRRVIIINTLDARLKRATPYLRCYLGSLFEKWRSETAVIHRDEIAAEA